MGVAFPVNHPVYIIYERYIASQLFRSAWYTRVNNKLYYYISERVELLVARRGKRYDRIIITVSPPPTIALYTYI
jgi:hypothetical protein